MAENEREYIWVSRWEDFQTYTTKRGKPWVPPWIKIYPRLLDEPAFLDLSPETRMVLVGIWMLFGRSHGTVTRDTRRLSRQLSQRVTKHQLETLNHAGFIRFCSGTVREQLRNTFWNGSSPDIEQTQTKKEEQDQEHPNPTPLIARPHPQNGSGGEGTEKGLEPLTQTVDELLANLRGAA